MKPHAIVRKADVRAKFIPVSATTLDDLIEEGLLKTVKLSDRAVGVTMQSIIAYQKKFMGLEPLADDAPGGGEAIVMAPKKLSAATLRKRKRNRGGDKPDAE